VEGPVRGGWGLIQGDRAEEHCQEESLRYAVLRAGNPGHLLCWRRRLIWAHCVGVWAQSSLVLQVIEELPWGCVEGAWHASSLRLPLCSGSEASSAHSNTGTVANTKTNSNRSVNESISIDTANS